MTKYHCPQCGFYFVVKDMKYRERNKTCARCEKKHLKKKERQEQFHRQKATA